MVQHLRASLWLLLLSVVICCIVYPIILLGIGQTVFPEKANGSLIIDKDGNAIGSRMIAQPFTADEYFHPRPSAVSYNGAASGASNWGPSNPALRRRVEGALGSVLKYRDGRPVGPDIAAWAGGELEKDRGNLAKWMADDSGIAEHWAGSEIAVAEFLTKWQSDHQDEVSKWREANPGVEIAPKDVAGLFLETYTKDASIAWPETSGSDLATAFFQVWWAAHSD